VKFVKKWVLGAPEAISMWLEACVARANSKIVDRDSRGDRVSSTGLKGSVGIMQTCTCSLLSKR
jgi:hypothetical protein